MRRQLKINNLKVMNKDIVKISSAARSARCGMYVLLRITTGGVYNIYYLLATTMTRPFFALKKRSRKTPAETEERGDTTRNCRKNCCRMPICAPPAGVYVSAGTRQKVRVYDSSVSVSDKKILHDVISAACAPAPEARYIKMT